jgi:transcriptional antiterminator RfaH
MHWYLIHTNSQQEQRASLNLEQKGYECYLPLLEIKKLCRGLKLR